MSASPISLTQELVRFDTVNPPGNEFACAKHLGALLEENGFAVTYQEFADGRANLVARLGGIDAAPPLCFTGHIDTVPLGAQSWSVDPFGGEVADGRLYGRGSTDMKSGVAAFCLAAISLADHLRETRGLELVITAGEETGCQGACKLTAKAGPLGRAGAIVVAEPSSNRPWLGHKGALWLRAVTNGVSAHGSMPEHGVNAVYKAARAVSKLEDFDFNIARHPVIGPPTVNVGTIHGGININSVPDQAEFCIDLRTIPTQDHNRLRAQLGTYLGNEIVLETIVDLAGIWTEPTSDWAQEVLAIVADVTDRIPKIEAANYFTDASVLAPAYGNPPTIVLGPGEAAMAHQTDEYCLVACIEEALQIYTEIARRWCGL